MSAQVCAFGKVLAQQAVGVLIRPSLPRAMKRSNQSGKANTSRDINNSSIPDPISNRFRPSRARERQSSRPRFRAVTSRRHDLEQDLTGIHNWTGIDVEVLPVYPAKDIGGTIAKNLPHRCGWAVAPPFQFDQTRRLPAKVISSLRRAWKRPNRC